MMMVPQQREEKPNLTLYGIETQLLELLNLRDEVLADADMTPREQKESVDAIDRQVQEYVGLEVRKCDGIARYLREFETRAAALKSEAKRCAEAAKAWEKRQENLESMVIQIMQQTGHTRIDGKHSVLQLKKNPPSVEVSQPDMVPESYQRVTVTMSAALWQDIRNTLANAGMEKTAATYFAIVEGAKLSAPEPMKDKIREELKAGGAVPGCRLKTDGVRLEVK